MNKEADDKHTAFLELSGGLNGIDYPQKFVKAPLSAYPTKPSSQGKAVPVNAEAMKISEGC